MDRDKQLHPTEKVPSIQRSRGLYDRSLPPTKPASWPERLRERCLERGSPNHSSMHSNLSVNSKPKNMLLMIRNGDRPSQSLRAETRGLDSKSDSFLVTVTHGRLTLKESHFYHIRQTNIEESDPGSPTVNNQRPSSTNSFHPPPKVQPRQTCTYKSREKKTGMHDGHPRRVVSCRILQSPGKSPNTPLLPEENTPDIEQSNQWSSDQVQWISRTNFHESIAIGQLE